MFKIHIPGAKKDDIFITSYGLDLHRDFRWLVEHISLMHIDVLTNYSRQKSIKNS